MNIEVITTAIERYFNSEVEDFEWTLVEDECRYEKKYYFNLLERLLGNYNRFLDNVNYKYDFLVSLRCFLISYNTALMIPEKLIKDHEGYGLLKNADGRIYASIDAPEYINTKFVTEAFQTGIVKSKKDDNRYLLKTNEFIRNLTGYECYNSEAQKLCVTGVLRLPDGYSSMVVLPTGGGKSLVTQALAYKEDGLTVVIVPTISLAIDQEIAAKNSIQHVTNREIFSYSSGSSNAPQIFTALQEKTARLLFISPEALIKNEEFVNAIMAANKEKYLKNIVIDEAHIVVEWGDLFRTDYQILEPWRKKLLHDNPEIKTVLLSATVDSNTGMLLKNMFSFQDKWVEFRCDSLRKEPRYCVINCKSYYEKKRRLLELVRTMPHPLIIYTMRPDKAEKIKEWIIEDGYNGVETFTGETNSNERDELIRGWKKNEFDVMVATSAFGMGVDKPDVRTVIHEFVPDNPNMYYQELGRGGRDSLPSLSILCLYPEEDLEFSRRNKVLSVDKIIGRWKSMFWSPKSTRVDDYAFIDTKIKPTYNLTYKYDIANARDVQWNIYVLLLFRRYNLIEIMDMQYEKTEERYVFKIKVIEERLSVIDEATEQLLLDVRNHEKDRYAAEFETLKKAIINSSKECFSEMFIKTYPRVSEYCAGCGCHNKVICDEDDRFALSKKIDLTYVDTDLVIKEDSLILTKNVEEILAALGNKGAKNYVSCEKYIPLILSDRPETFSMNLYEFRRIVGSKNIFYLQNVCCVVYSEDPDVFKKEFSTIQRYINRGFRFIHVVTEDFDVDSTGKRISAYIGNNITDSILEESYV